MIDAVNGMSSMWGRMNAGNMRPNKEEMFNRIDQNADGGIDEDEMQVFADKHSEITGETIDVSDLISKFDSDEDGKLNEDEAQATMESIKDQMNMGMGPARQRFDTESIFIGKSLPEMIGIHNTPPFSFWRRYYQTSLSDPDKV